MLRRLFDYTLLWLAVAAGGYAVWELRELWARQPEGEWLWYLLILAGLLGGVALRRMEVWLPDTQPPAHPVSVPGARRQKYAYICLLLAAGLTSVVVLALWPNYRVWQGTQWPWLAALLLTLLGGWLVSAIGEPAADQAPAQAGSAQPDLGYGSVAIPRWFEVCAFLLIGALAIFLRTYRLNEIPAGIYVDETNGALDALHILEGSGDSPFATGWYESPNGFAYYMAALFKIFGANYYSLKAVSLIPAILTVLAIYPLGRVLFGPLTAISAMLLMAVSRWHLTMSRWGWAEVAPLVFQILATFFLIRGLRERRALDFAAGGLLSGLMVYTYLSSRLALATLAVFGAYWMLADPAGLRASWNRHWKGFALFLLAAFIAAAPIAVTYLTNPFSFMNRISQVSIFNQVREEGSYRPLIENVQRHLKFFHQSGDRNGKHNLPGEPQTDPITGVLFVIGLGYGLARFRDRRRGLLWIWVVFAMIGGVFSVLHESPQAFRTLNAVPAIALLAGDVLARLARGLVWLRPVAVTPSSRPIPVFRTAVAGIVLVGVLSSAAAWETNLYFGPQAESPRVKGSFNLTENAVAKEVIDALNRGTVVYLSPRFYYFSPLRFLVYGVIKEKTGRNSLNEHPYQLARPEVDLPVPDTGTDALFLLDSYYWSVRGHFHRFYPDAEFTMPLDPEHRPLYVSVRLSQSDVAAVTGLEAEFTYADGSIETQTVPRVDETWNRRDVTAARWTGGVRIARSGTYDFVPDGDVQVVVDGQLWTASRFLGRGLHTLQVTQRESNRYPAARLAWTTPSEVTETVPNEAFFRASSPTQGLTARYYPNEDWQGEPLFSQTTPFVLLFWPDGEPVLPPFSARFTGYLRIDQPGIYWFRLRADDGVRLLLDGELLGEALTPLRLNQLDVTTELSTGDHPIQIDYFQRGGSNILEFFWRRRGEGQETPVPPSALVPEGVEPAPN